jgi:hypothetical protein
VGASDKYEAGLAIGKQVLGEKYVFAEEAAGTKAP